MKQGHATSTSATSHKANLIAKAVNPAAVAEIGIHEVRTRSEPLYAGKGFGAPAPVATTSHHSGSQGKHK